MKRGSKKNMNRFTLLKYKFEEKNILFKKWQPKQILSHPQNMLIYANYLKKEQPISFFFSPKDAHLIFRYLQKRW